MSPPPGPKAPLTLWLKTARPGQKFVSLEHTDDWVHSLAVRAGVSVSTERASLVSGSHAKPAIRSAIVVTMTATKRTAHEPARLD